MTITITIIIIINSMQLYFVLFLLEAHSPDVAACLAQLFGLTSYLYICHSM